MTWLLSESCQLLAVAISVRYSFKLLKKLSSSSLGLEVGLGTAKYDLQVQQGADILKFWVIFALLRIFELYAEFTIRWFPFYYYIKAFLFLAICIPELKIAHLLFSDLLIPAISKAQQKLSDHCDLGENGEVVLPTPAEVCLSITSVLLLLVFPAVSSSHRQMKRHFSTCSSSGDFAGLASATSPPVHSSLHTVHTQDGHNVVQEPPGADRAHLADDALVAGTEAGSVADMDGYVIDDIFDDSSCSESDSGCESDGGDGRFGDESCGRTEGEEFSSPAFGAGGSSGANIGFVSARRGTTVGGRKKSSTTSNTRVRGGDSFDNDGDGSAESASPDLAAGVMLFGEEAVGVDGESSSGSCSADVDRKDYNSQIPNIADLSPMSLAGDPTRIRTAFGSDSDDDNSCHNSSVQVGYQDSVPPILEKARGKRSVLGANKRMSALSSTFRMFSFGVSSNSSAADGICRDGDRVASLKADHRRITASRSIGEAAALVQDEEAEASLRIAADEKDTVVPLRRMLQRSQGHVTSQHQHHQHHRVVRRVSYSASDLASPTGRLGGNASSFNTPSSVLSSGGGSGTKHYHRRVSFTSPGVAGECKEESEHKRGLAGAGGKGDKSAVDVDVDVTTVFTGIMLSAGGGSVSSNARSSIGSDAAQTTLYGSSGEVSNSGLRRRRVETDNDSDDDDDDESNERIDAVSDLGVVDSGRKGRRITSVKKGFSQMMQAASNAGARLQDKLNSPQPSLFSPKQSKSHNSSNQLASLAPSIESGTGRSKPARRSIFSFDIYEAPTNSMVRRESMMHIKEQQQRQQQK